MTALLIRSIFFAQFFISSALHPHFNLSLEHVLLQTSSSDKPIGLLYRNSPCIVIGRNQNPWRELDVTAMRKLGIRLVRRRSGGGAVYHDLGNSNYSFNVEKDQFTRRFHAELVARALNGDPISLTSGSSTDRGDASRGAYVNHRNDICIALQKGNEERKISGSAYKITSRRAYHHGTMLLSSNLAQLGTSLRPSRATMVSKGVASVPSPVVNLTEAFASRRFHLTHDDFCSAILKEFQRQYGKSVVCAASKDQTVEALTSEQQQELSKSWNEMNRWDWIWGQTPEFTHRVRFDGRMQLPSNYTPVESFEVDIHVRSGVIQSAILRMDRFDAHDEDLTNVVTRLTQKPYDVLADAPDTFGFHDEKPGWNGSSTLDFSTEEQTRASAIAHQFLKWLKNVL